ncbi:MAG: hypothetical protein NT003_00995 [Candidatus Magasanikbacteria bacterium]|nr:hypothetical protein [Candidatus Magasanikbacteria bacterium]
MYSNPFDRKITPAAETDREQNKKLLDELLGSETAAEYDALVAGQPNAVKKDRGDLKMRAAEAIATEPSLLKKARESQIEQFISELRFQSQQQMRALTELGFIIMEKGQRGIQGIDEKFYQAPRDEEIVAHFANPERRDFYQQKISEGFTRLLIVPFATRLETIKLTLEAELEERFLNNKVFDQNKDQETFSNPIEILEQAEPFDDGDVNSDEDPGGVIKYYPDFNSSSIGQTKREILADPTQPFPGYNVLLVHDPELYLLNPKQDYIEGRVANGSSIMIRDYVASMHDPNSTIFGEVGLTLEDTYMTFLMNLHISNLLVRSTPQQLGLSLVSIATYVEPCNKFGTDFDEEWIPDTFWASSGGKLKTLSCTSSTRMRNFDAYSATAIK